MSGRHRAARAQGHVLRAVGVALLLCCTACSRPAAPILTWHSVGEGHSEFTVPEPLFLQQLDALVQAGAVSVPLDDVLRGPPLPLHAVALTFDDGTADAVSVVLPALQARHLRATFFVVAGLVSEDGEPRRVLTEDGDARPTLTWDELRRLRDAGMWIGSHSLTHPRLPEVPREKQVLEIASSKVLLEQRLGQPVLFFAYPYNSLRSGTRGLVRDAGYRGAVAGVAHGDGHPYSLRRIPVKRDTAPAQLAEVVR